MFVKPKRSVSRVFLHCTAYPHADLFGKKLRDAVNSWHVARGWDQIGYHFLIDLKGELIPGRSLELNPIAQSGNNTRTIAICLDGLRVEQFNEAQFCTLRTLADEIDNAYGKQITWHGHCEVSSKSCPVFDYKTVLGLDADGRRIFSPGVALGFVEEQADIVSHTNIGSRILQKTNRGQDVAWVQKRLGIDDDGIFGQDTYNAIRRFQDVTGLAPSGIVDSETWNALRGV